MQTQCFYQTCETFRSKLNDVPCSFCLATFQDPIYPGPLCREFLTSTCGLASDFCWCFFALWFCSLDREWSLTSSFHTCSYQREITQFDSVCRSVEHYTHEEYIKKVVLMCTHTTIIGFLSLPRETWWNMGVSNLIIVDHRRSIIAIYIYIQLPLYLVHTDIYVSIFWYMGKHVSGHSPSKGDPRVPRWPARGAPEAEIVATGVDGAWVIQPLSTWETTEVYFSWLQHPLKKFEFVFLLCGFVFVLVGVRGGEEFPLYFELTWS